MLSPLLNSLGPPRCSRPLCLPGAVSARAVLPIVVPVSGWCRPPRTLPLAARCLPLAAVTAMPRLVLLLTAQQLLPLMDLGFLQQHCLLVGLERAPPLLQGQLRIRQVQERVRQLQSDQIVHQRIVLVVRLVGTRRPRRCEDKKRCLVKA